MSGKSHLTQLRIKRLAWRSGHFVRGGDALIPVLPLRLGLSRSFG